MAVEGVNNNNAALYAGAGAAVAGGAIGGTTGYLTKSFLNDKAPTDEFVKKALTNFENNLTNDEAKQALKNIIEFNPSEAKSIDELKEALYKNYDQAIDAGEDTINTYKNALDKKFEGKTLEECIDIAKEEGENIKKIIVNDGLKEGFDFDKKKFVKIEDSMTGNKKAMIKSLKDAASSIKWKAAGIYGGIAAALLGIGTYLGVANGMKSQAPEAAAEEQVAEPQQTEA